MLKKLSKKVIFIFLLCIFCLCTLSFINLSQILAEPIPPGILLLQYSYPDLTFTATYQKNIDDWKIDIKIPGEGLKTLYWADGAMLPKEELDNRSQYWSILYSYPKELTDPSTLTAEEQEKIKKFSSTENRANGAGAAMFFFDAVYGSSSRKKLEKNLVHVAFLGCQSIIHKRIKTPLKRVEKRIKDLAKVDTEVEEFINNIKSTGAYNWRIIQGTKRKSFHSLGIAIDILPKRLGGKAIFWSWQKDKYPDTWMLTPISDRWLPPKKVIDIFEDEGFIWGGKWAIFDNMHFEYHPELIYYNKIKEF